MSSLCRGVCGMEHTAGGAHQVRIQELADLEGHGRFEVCCTLVTELACSLGLDQQVLPHRVKACGC